MNAETLTGKVLGTCTLQKLIGRGGMGAVFLAQQSRPRRQVAVKVLLPMNRLQPGQHAAFLARFRRETDAAAALEHPNIMPVHEYGESEGLAYLVMPYVSGGTLRDELDREGTLPFTRVVSYLEQMADALSFAHERGIVHRDIKPANLMLTPDKRLLLTDFGLVKIIAEGHISQNPLSDVGMPMGTPDYMSPEQVVGGEVDPRADIYSLGVLTYHMVTGTVPFHGEMPMKVALQHLHNVPPSPRVQRPDLPAEAEQAILRTMAKRPDERYVHARDFAQAFRQALENAGVVLDPQPTTSMQALGDRAAVNRPRGLFDPLWRNAMRTPELPEQHDQKQSPPKEKPKQDQKNLPAIAEPAEPLVEDIAVSTLQNAQPVPASPSGGDHNTHDIVAKTSMTLPSFSGLLVPLVQQPANTTTAKNTPLPAIDTMEKNPFHPRPAQPQQGQGPYAPPQVPPGAEAQQGNPPFSPPRLRFGNKTNFLGNNQDQAPQPAQPGQPGQPGQTGVFPPPQGNFGGYPAQPMQPSPAPFQNQGGMQQQQQQQQQQPGQVSGSGTFSPSFGPQAGMSGIFPPSGQPGSTGVFNNYGQQPQPGMTGTLNNPGPRPGATGALPHPGMTGTYGFNPPQPGAPGMTGTFNTYGGRMPTGALPGAGPQPGSTGALMIPVNNESTGQTGMLKLTQPVKVIKVPVAGQPGQYVTGLLPVLNDYDGDGIPDTPRQIFMRRLRNIGLILALVVILGGSLAYLLTRGNTASPTNPTRANPTATAQVNATATAYAGDQANIIVSDTLTENRRNWYTGERGNANYFFKDGSYHIKTKGEEGKAGLTILPQQVPDTFAYTLSMKQLEGVDDSEFNFYGLVFRYGNTEEHTYFYAFALVNDSNGGKYTFRKYSSTASEEERWLEIQSWPVGDEGKLGKGQENTFKVVGDKTHFTFFVNGKEIGKAEDGSWPHGEIGMFVNYKDTEVAFRELFLTYK